MTDSYEIRFVKSFERDVRSLPREIVSVVVGKTLALAEDPRPPQSRKLRGAKDEYRLRVRNYRVFYSVDDAVRLVTVFHVAHRREAYGR